MRAATNWNFRPYRPADEAASGNLPFIVRMSVTDSSIEAEWIDNGDSGAHFLEYTRRGGKDFISLPANSDTVKISGLEYDTEYELCVVRADGTRGNVRIANTVAAPCGTMVNYLHPEDNIYEFSGHSLCSPDVIRLPSGRIIVSNDIYLHHAPQNLTVLVCSDDNGETWHWLADLFPCFWAKLFMLHGRLYMFGCSTEFGDIVIGYSEDEGKTWSAPAHIFVGGGMSFVTGWQTCPTPALIAGGRVWLTVDYGSWEKLGGFLPAMFSFDENSDPMKPENWVCTDFSCDMTDGIWERIAPKNTNKFGMLEGSPIIKPDGGLGVIMRVGLVNAEIEYGKAVLLDADINNPEAALVPKEFIDMPSGSNSRSHVIFDAVSGCYIAAGNICTNPATPAMRSVLALQASRDLKNWKVIDIVVDRREIDPQREGYQYPSFIIDGDDVLLVSRSSIKGAHNFHDANCTTLHRIKNFRSLI